jgi:voltage-dependent potassium channel beta subunit
MNYRKVGRYGLKVSEVALGGWLTHGRTLDDEATASIVRKALDLGINFFDTADIYNKGEAEKALARALRGVRREDLVIATKCFFPMSDDPNDRGLSRKHIVESVNQSLARLQTDYIDLMQFHRFDADTPVDETVRAIDDLIKQGKALYWGTSEWRAHQITEAWHLAKELNAHLPISNQPMYNMLEPRIEQDVLPTCEHLGMGQVVFSPLAEGVLTGKYEPGKPPPQGSRGADEKSNMFMQDVLHEDVLTRVQKLKGFVQGQGFELPQFALAWCLRQPGVSAVIVGATKVEQLEANVVASALQVSPEIFEQAHAFLTGK